MRRVRECKNKLRSTSKGQKAVYDATDSHY